MAYTSQFFFEMVLCVIYDPTAWPHENYSLIRKKEEKEKKLVSKYKIPVTNTPL